MNIAIIVGAGSGTRMQSKINKVFLTLVDKPIICYSIEAFEQCKSVDKIILVTKKEDIDALKKLVENKQYKKITKIIEGGEERQDSVFYGIQAIESPLYDDIVIIHNAANPIINQDLIIECINAAIEYGASVAAVKCRDTIKEADPFNNVKATLDRSNLFLAQTPQCFTYHVAKDAFWKASESEFYGTDDAMLAERIGQKVKIVECDAENFKITTEHDLLVAEKLQGNARIGLGQDSHKFSEKEKQLILGGIIIPNERGLEANSDGDVVLHAIFNALSQAAGGLSIGNYADLLYEKGIKDSSTYLKIPLKNIEKKNLEINNIGIMIEAKKPFLRDYEPKIKDNVAKLCDIDSEKVGIAITSGEEMTSFGQGLGIQCFVVVSLMRK